MRRNRPLPNPLSTKHLSHFRTSNFRPKGRMLEPGWGNCSSLEQGERIVQTQCLSSQRRNLKTQPQLPLGERAGFIPHQHHPLQPKTGNFTLPPPPHRLSLQLRGAEAPSLLRLTTKESCTGPFSVLSRANRRIPSWSLIPTPLKPTCPMNPSLAVERSLAFVLLPFFLIVPPSPPISPRGFHPLRTLASPMLKVRT